VKTFGFEFSNMQYNTLKVKMREAIVVLRQGDCFAANYADSQ
jgi:hypothetical protein